MFQRRKNDPHEEFSFFLGDLEERPAPPAAAKEAPKKRDDEPSDKPRQAPKRHLHAARVPRFSNEKGPEAPKKPAVGAASPQKVTPEREETAPPQAPSTPKRSDTAALLSFLGLRGEKTHETKREEGKEPLPEKKAEAVTKKKQSPKGSERAQKKELPKALRTAQKKEPPEAEPEEKSAPQETPETQKKEEAPKSPEEAVKESLDALYGSEPGSKKTLKPGELARYAVLFVCIFGFFSAFWFVGSKLYDYYRSWVVYSGLQEMVEREDLFAEEYLKKATPEGGTLTPGEILEGKDTVTGEITGTFTPEQETLVGKISQLKKLNPDTTGWIRISGTVVNYPLMWSSSRNYYLHRDFYGNTLSGGAIFIDERNDRNVAKNRNTVIYGHNMSDGSMFASIHDFQSATLFFGATIEIATEDGIYVYTPFSVHRSNAHDNYFETDFVSDEDFINFCEQMAFLSIFETDYSFDRNTQIITLSTCMDTQTNSENRFAVHAILTKVIR